MEGRDTIAAVATAPGRGGVAVVRVSGPDAFAVAERVAGRAPRPGRIQFASFRAPPAAPGEGARVLDAGVLLSFRAPRSYTGEDVVEFQCHGGSVTPRRVLEACFAAGARLARRGEFTARAFLNGKLALDQAEAVLALVDAKTDRAADLAAAELTGAGRAPTRRGALRAAYDAALALSAAVEHALDVSEEELPAAFHADLAAGLAALRAQLDAARTRARERALLDRGALVVLAGPPNAGKSSLLNALAGADRAIVSDVPGTTRDAVEVWLDWDGWPVRLVDTAGLRAAADAVEAEGVRRSAALAAAAEVVVDLGGGFPDDGRVVAVHAKCDLGRGPGLNVSSVTGEGLAALRRAVVAKLAARAADFVEEAPEGGAAVFHEALALLAALPPDPRDLVVAGSVLQRVGAKLGAALGAAYSEDLLDRLFSRFCVGK